MDGITTHVYAKLAPALARVSHADMQLVLDDRAQFKLQVVLLKKPKTSFVEPFNAAELDHLDKRFELATSREQAIGWLEGMNRAQLMSIGKHVFIAERHSLSKPQLIERIVESRVGARLGREAFFRTTLR